MNRLDFDQSGGFPMSTEILQAMQTSYNSLNELGRISGDKTIISGCEIVGSACSSGFVVINGELLFFKPGTVGDYVIIQEVAEDQQGFEDGSAKPIIYERYATFGTADVQYAWAEFKRPLNLLQIEAKLTQLENMVPIGLVAIWDRPADAIPAGWVEHTDLAGKTAVGHLDGDVNFGALGGNLGAAQVTLTESQLPEHRHKIATPTSQTSYPLLTGSTFMATINNEGNDGNYVLGGVTTEPSVGLTSKVGGNQAHSNIQPSRIVKYIRFVGFN